MDYVQGHLYLIRFNPHKLTRWQAQNFAQQCSLRFIEHFDYADFVIAERTLKENLAHVKLGKPCAWKPEARSRLIIEEPDYNLTEKENMVLLNSLNFVYENKMENAMNTHAWFDVQYSE